MANLTTWSDSKISETLLDANATWEDYINNVLISSGNGGYISKAGIYSKNGKKWAASEDLELYPIAIKDILAAFDDSTKIRETGIYLGERLFTMTRITDRTLFVARESKTGAGLIVYRCETCIVVGVCEEGASQAGCYIMIMKVGDYLTDMGF